MADSHALLVVDDEEVICQACRRIFSRQGFQVDTNTNPRQGLTLAAEKDYDIILLDIKMPSMDGIEFLEHLRQTKREVPVLIITGYPSIPNAAAAMRLGACDYVSKPFTSEEITSAVQRVLATRRLDFPDEPEAAAKGEEAMLAMLTAESPIMFWGESWFRMEVDGSACVGAVLPGLRGTTPAEVRLPRIGEVVYQGLPLGSVTVPGRPPLIVASPISGVVMAVNESLPKHLCWINCDPCGEGWLAHICTTEYDREAEQCGPRRVVLANADPALGHEQLNKLSKLGCSVELVADRDALTAALKDKQERVVFVDAASFGVAGPDLVGLVNQHAPLTRVVVVAAAGDPRESAYRKHKILYYAVEPFADGEIADILAAAFPFQEPPPAERHKGPSEPISGITITNRHGHSVQLLAAPGLLWRAEGLGRHIGQKLLAQMLPVVMTPGVANLSPSNILKTAVAHDHVMVLLARDGGYLPGSLARDTKPNFGVDPGDAAGKITTLAVQPDATGGFAGLDPRTTLALADHMVREMCAY
ncbi:MAG: response regulator [Pirellulaceae bacterium]|jgi:DNA-binding response OmpR family regulator|nr:response regulator [Pirellulaceae bacterium]